MQVFRTEAHVAFKPDQMVRRIFHDSEKVRLIMLCIEEGQELPPHVLEGSDGWVYLAKGRAIMTVDGEKREVAAGDLIVAPSGASRGFKALERVVAIGGAAPGLNLPEIKAEEKLFERAAARA